MFRMCKNSSSITHSKQILTLYFESFLYSYITLLTMYGVINVLANKFITTHGLIYFMVSISNDFKPK